MMTNQIKVLLVNSKCQNCLQRILLRNLSIRTSIPKNFNRFRTTIGSIKPRHIVIAAVSTTVVTGLAASLGLAGLVLTGAHNAVFSHQDENKSHLRDVVQKENDCLPTEYDISAIQAYWQKRPREVLLRMTEVAIVFGPYITKSYIDARS